MFILVRDPSSHYMLCSLTCWVRIWKQNCSSCKIEGARAIILFPSAREPGLSRIVLAHMLTGRKKMAKYPAHMLTDALTCWRFRSHMLTDAAHMLTDALTCWRFRSHMLTDAAHMLTDAAHMLTVPNLCIPIFTNSRNNDPRRNPFWYSESATSRA